MTEYGYCECGCGEKTRISPETRKERGYVKGEPRRFLQGHQHHGRNNGAWKGGRFVRSDGYVMLHNPDHPRSDGTHVMEHVVVAEKAFGRPLPERVVIHHVDEDRANNRPENLVICPDRKYHNLLHRRMKAKADCGHAHWRRCWMCGEYSPPDEVVQYPSHTTAVHRACAARRVREYKARKKAQAASSRRARPSHLSEG